MNVESITRPAHLNAELPTIIVLGNQSQGGSYILHMHVKMEIQVRFGRFGGGKAITMPAGEVLYLGSAMKGLGRRLIRHATRSSDLPPHPIRAEMLDEFPALGISKGNLSLPKGKKLHWNVDHLLDRPEVRLTHVIVLRSAKQLERRLGRFLLEDPHTSIVAEGLGANDIPGNTHILCVNTNDEWWGTLPDRLKTFLKHF